MPADQAVDERDLVREKQPEAETEEARGEPQIALDSRRAPGGVGERRTDCRRNQHHPGNRAEAEEHEIRHGPPRVLDQCENQQRHRRGAREAMNETNSQRSEDLVDPETTELPVQPRHRSLVVAVPMLLRSGAGRVVMDVIAMAVQMRAEGAGTASDGRPKTADLLKDAREVPHPQYN